MAKTEKQAKRRVSSEQPRLEAVAAASSSPAPIFPISTPPPPDLDRLIHERLRLGIVTALAVNESLTFNELKKLLKTSDGNLSVHARRLEEAGYISCTKAFERRMPRTDYRLAAAGRRALDRYLNHMESLIHAMRDK